MQVRLLDREQCDPQPGAVKIVLMDGGRNLWGYVNATKLYDDFEMLFGRSAGC